MQLNQVTNFYFLRHGLTNANEEGCLSGGGDNKSELTNLGENQALELGEKISSKKIDLKIIYSSDLPRAKKTTELVIEGLNTKSAPEIVFAPQLREILHGPYELTKAVERDNKATALINREILKLEGRNIPEELSTGSLDPYFFWKIHPICENISNENSPIKKISSFLNEENLPHETVYELHLRLQEEIERIAKESFKNGHSNVGVSTHGGVLATLIDGCKYQKENVFIPPFYAKKEAIQNDKQVMPLPTKVANCALIHFRYYHQTKTLEFGGFI